MEPVLDDTLRDRWTQATVDERDDVGYALQLVDGRIVRATTGACTMLGLSRDQMLGRTSADPNWAALAPDGGPLRGQDHPSMRALSGEEDLLGQVLGLHRPGFPPGEERIWVNVDCRLVRHEGTLLGVLSRFTAVGPEQDAVLRMREELARVRVFADRSSDMISRHTPAGDYVYASPSFARFLGYDPVALVGRSAYELFHPFDLAAISASHASNVTTEDVAYVTYRIRHADGHWVWVETTSHMVRDDAGDPLEIQSATRDITSRMIEQSLYRAALEAAPYGVGVLDLDGVWQEVNPALCELFGLDPPAVRGAPVLAAPLDATLRSGIQRALTDARDGSTRGWSGQGTVRSAQGACLTVEVALAVALGPDDRPLHLVLHVQDVTEKAAAVRELSRLASTDPLTGLPNRREALALLTQHTSAARSDALAVIFCDIDGFKHVNDTWGHDVGDALLRAVAASLRRTVRVGDIVTRIAGDEFVVLAPCEDEARCHRLAARLSELCIPVPDRDGQRVTLSVGLSFPVAGDGPEQILRRADAAMYQAKRRRRDAMHRTSPTTGPSVPPPRPAPEHTAPT